ncbi:MAG: PQQ-binding-like beta-propeller repeat protein [Bacteroidales bacterium]|nr:PQQ-binding-like beta-propeller repeat protein [Bacteroidales bacterium]
MQLKIYKQKDNRGNFRFFVNFYYLTLILLSSLGCSSANDNPSQWRGPDRRGIYYEEGLLQEWPEEGPGLLWSFEGLGAGHSSVAVGHDRIFVTGMTDTIGVLFSFDLDGNLLWEKQYGPEWHVTYGGSRATPVIVDDFIYLESGQGIVYCFNAFSGEVVWHVDLFKKFNAENITWGKAETLLVDGDRIICTPGGSENNVVALDRHTGKTIWTSKGFGEPAAYCSPVLVMHNNSGIIVTMTATSVIGIDADTGEFYWREEQQQANKIHANSPVYSDGIIFCSSASARNNDGLLALKLSEDGRTVEKLWRNRSYINVMGGIILLDGVIYGGKYRSSEWYAIDTVDGKMNLLNDKLRAGVIVYADGLIFDCYRSLDSRRQPILLQPNGGRVGIGTKSPSQVLHVVGNAYKTEGGTAWATSSDLRLKTLLGNYDKGLREIVALQPVRFIYNEGNPRKLSTDIEQVGFVAQEVQKVFPEAVSEADDGFLDFNIHAINVALINAVKELKAENDLLKERLEKLEQLVGASAYK